MGRVGERIADLCRRHRLCRISGKLTTCFLGLSWETALRGWRTGWGWWLTSLNY